MRGRELIEDIESSESESPTLWWLGHSGFVLKFHKAIIYVDPRLSKDGPLDPRDVSHAGLILCTGAHYLDPGTLPHILAASRRARLVIPKRVAEHARAMGIGFERMVTTDSGLRVEYLDDRVYAVPSARDELDWTPLGGYACLGYLVRFGNCTIYHAGDCVPYAGLADRLRPYNVTMALLPVSGRPHGFEASEAAQLAEDIGARWLVPMRHDTGNSSRFVEHMLGHRPGQRFKIFEIGEKWEAPH